MDQLTGRHFFQGIIYNQFCEFADMGSFMSYIDPIFDGTIYDYSDVRKSISSFIEEEKPSQNDPTVDCLRILATELLSNSIDLMNDESFFRHIIKQSSVIDMLNNYNDKVHEYVSNNICSIKKPELFFVDIYPEPFSDKSFIAMSFDESDMKIYGIAPGIYFRKNMLRPTYSSFMLFHEWIHFIMSRGGEQFFGGPLEEGLAELFGFMFLGSKFFGYERALSMHVYHRMFSKPVKSLDLYLDYTRSAELIYINYGVSGIIDLLSGSRVRLKSIEQKMWGVGPAKLNLKSGGWVPEFTDMLQRALGLFGKNSVCSPLAKFVSRYTKVGLTINDISSSSGLEAAAVKSGLVELSGAPRLVELNGEIVSYSDCERLVSPMQLRFTVPNEIKIK